MSNTVTKDDLDKLALKLIEHIDKGNKELKQEIEKIDEKYNQLLTTLDAFLKRLDNIEANDAARDMQLARHDRWLEQIATKTGIKLTY